MDGREKNNHHTRPGGQAPSPSLSFPFCCRSLLPFHSSNLFVPHHFHRVLSFYPVCFYLILFHSSRYVNLYMPSPCFLWVFLPQCRSSNPHLCPPCLLSHSGFISCCAVQTSWAELLWNPPLPPPTSLNNPSHTTTSTYRTTKTHMFFWILPHVSSTSQSLV